MNEWPDFLPPPSLQGYTLQPQSRTIRTEMTSGPARVRRRFTRVPTMIPQVWNLSDKDFGAFEWWVANSIDGGAAWFMGPQRNGTGRVSVQCRFVDRDGPYKARYLGAGEWEVSAMIEVDQMPLGSLTDFWPADVPTLDLDFLTQTYKVAG